MTARATAQPGLPGSSPLRRAVDRRRGISRATVLDWMFARAFDGLVYAQIWEDPVVDMDAMDIRPGHHIVALASGGCNAMSYLSRSPAKVTAVDLNVAHLSLVELKKAAALHLPSHRAFLAMFADFSRGEAVRLYDENLRQHLPAFARDYWDARVWSGRRRITIFATNPYRHGLLGRFISIGHIVARLNGVNPADVMGCKTIEDQRAFFDEKIGPLFDRKFIRWITASPVSLYGLGIPPAQYVELAGDRHMADVLRERTEKLTCGFPLSENYFARQAFGRGYDGAGAEAALPPYLEAGNWSSVRDHAARLNTVNLPVTEHLATLPSGSVDRFVYLDAQDWMDTTKLDALWRETTRTAKPGARVIFRTAGQQSIIEGRIAASVRSRWTYHDARSRALHARDRSAIYGGFHLYELMSQ